ncbi:hypothetical protein [Rubrimonas sp.]|uniref:hypothetical protein n=1 Tax=Rubrimonas sp. TaxID=2036015 RepID=UPI002FDCCF5D
MADISPPRRRMFEDMTVRKGGKERSATLSTQPLAIPRTYWRLADPGRWLFPERDADRQIEPTTPHAARRSARAAAGISEASAHRRSSAAASSRSAGRHCWADRARPTIRRLRRSLSPISLVGNQIAQRAASVRCGQLVDLAAERAHTDRLFRPHNAEFRQMRPEGVDQHSALAHEEITAPATQREPSPHTAPLHRNGPKRPTFTPSAASQRRRHRGGLSNRRLQPARPTRKASHSRRIVASDRGCVLAWPIRR